mmetsp:Transcript_30337/g.60013  ORF Transcript_30337/g.60013 Transcript_30337/m.60013 type:complete len:330 (+) Transcript_30337:136-1125(+)
MQTFASLLRSCALLALFTGSSGQSVPAGTLDEIRGELHELRAELADENAALRHENTALKNELRVELAEVHENIENKNALKFEEVKNELREVKNENTALHLELEDVRALFQTQPRRTVENNYFSCMSQDAVSGDIYFDGCNVHVRSGGGSTGATINGKGNLIIGYNEPRDSLMEVPESAEGLEDTEAKKVEAGELDVSDSRGGSHNLIIGDGHEYTSYGGIVTGWYNQISNSYSAVVGGYGNKATGKGSTVTGGQYNEATGRYSSISSGGNGNTASGDYSSVLGGESNDAQGEAAVVTGGLNNKAIGDRASVVGGRKNKARRNFSVVTGA